MSGGTCTPTGTTGSWNRATGSSNGWRQAAVDLSGYAGRQVELSITYVSDAGSGGQGAFVDNANLVVGESVADTADFETSLGNWRSDQWSQSGVVLRGSAAITTPHSVIVGFGLESIPAAQRATVIRSALAICPESRHSRPRQCAYWRGRSRSPDWHHIATTVSAESQNTRPSLACSSR
ncbi:hypothetical protein [Kibdelosporangium aridum]|uniref:hypothetical protein n=1 Tax=Kibdelosporangium aridum TaxID=2030 RepID=UPI0035EB1136